MSLLFKQRLTYLDLSPPVPAVDLGPPVPAVDLGPPVPAVDLGPPVPAVDLGPPVPAGTQFDELSPSGTVAGNTSDFIMSATATDTHCSHVFHERVPPRPLWPAPTSASSLWSPVYY